MRSNTFWWRWRVRYTWAAEPVPPWITGLVARAWLPSSCHLETWDRTGRRALWGQDNSSVPGSLRVAQVYCNSINFLSTLQQVAYWFLLGSCLTLFGSCVNTACLFQRIQVQRRWSRNFQWMFELSFQGLCEKDGGGDGGEGRRGREDSLSMCQTLA